LSTPPFTEVSKTTPKHLQQRKGKQRRIY